MYIVLDLYYNLLEPNNTLLFISTENDNGGPIRYVHINSTKRGLQSY